MLSSDAIRMVTCYCQGANDRVFHHFSCLLLLILSSISSPKAAVAARIDEADTDEVAIQLDSDSEADLFQPQGVVNSEAEYTKWMKQQPIARETDILK